MADLAPQEVTLRQSHTRREGLLPVVVATWKDGHCLACDQASRIADDIATAAGPPDDGAWRGEVAEAVLDTFGVAWDIARQYVRPAHCDLRTEPSPTGQVW